MILPELDGNRLRLVNWNIAKGRHFGWRGDLLSISRDADLILIQEARYEDNIPGLVENSYCCTFAPGYTRQNSSSGVLTMCRARTINPSLHQHREPWTRLPKAATVTEYALSGHPHNLLVANVHAINFTAGTRSFRRQLQALYEEMRLHVGPIVFSGDFNTWRRRRLHIVDEMVRALHLSPIFFPVDHRRQAFGYALDHIFVRGLLDTEAHVLPVYSSDHNPMAVELTATHLAQRQIA